MKNIDLHMHSNISLDGEFSPEILAKMCVESGLKVVSLTDHNSVRGVKRMETALEGTGIHLVKGIELDCCFEGVDLHLLGYGIDVEQAAFREVEEGILAQKRRFSGFRMDKMKEMGFYFQKEEAEKLAQDGIIIPEMLAEVIFKDDRNKGNPVLEPYMEGGTRADNPYVNFFWDFFSQGKACYAPVIYMSFKEAMDLIHAAEGICVIAHPGPVLGRDGERAARMAAMGIEGIEVYSSYHSGEDIVFWGELAQELGLLKTRGSDFHGKNKPSVRLGEIKSEL